MATNIPAIYNNINFKNLDITSLGNGSFGTLPIELVFEILSQLPNLELLKMKNLNKSWDKVIKMMPDLPLKALCECAHPVELKLKPMFSSQDITTIFFYPPNFEIHRNFLFLGGPAGWLFFYEPQSANKIHIASDGPFLFSENLYYTKKNANNALSIECYNPATKESKTLAADYIGGSIASLSDAQNSVAWPGKEGIVIYNPPKLLAEAMPTIPIKYIEDLTLTLKNLIILKDGIILRYDKNDKGIDNQLVFYDLNGNFIAKKTLRIDLLIFDEENLIIFSYDYDVNNFSPYPRYSITRFNSRGEGSMIGYISGFPSLKPLIKNGKIYCVVGDSHGHSITTYNIEKKLKEDPIPLSDEKKYINSIAIHNNILAIARTNSVTDDTESDLIEFWNLITKTKVHQLDAKRPVGAIALGETNGILELAAIGRRLGLKIWTPRIEWDPALGKNWELAIASKQPPTIASQVVSVAGSIINATWNWLTKK